MPRPRVDQHAGAVPQTGLRRLHDGTEGQKRQVPRLPPPSAQIGQMRGRRWNLKERSSPGRARRPLALPPALVARHGMRAGVDPQFEIPAVVRRRREAGWGARKHLGVFAGQRSEVRRVPSEPRRDWEFCNTMRERKINELNMQHIDSHVNIYMYIPCFISYNHYPS